MAARRRRHLLGALHAPGTALVTAGPVSAQDNYPGKAIKWIIPWPAGTPGDIAARIVGEHMGASMGQPIVIENRPGASGTIGYNEVLRQPADGYTLFMLGGPGLLVAPLMFPTRSFEYLKTLEPVGNTHWSYNALVVAPSSPFKDPKDIVAAGKSAPDSLSFASGGTGAPAHLAGELLNQQNGIKASHIPYTQFPGAITDVSTGRVSYMFMTTSAALAQIQGGKLRPIAVTSARRLSAMPDVPSMAELGFSNFVVRAFEGMTVKAGTPKHIVERLNSELNKVLTRPDVKERFAANGWEIEPTTPAQFRELIAAESDKWLRVGRAASIGPQ